MISPIRQLRISDVTVIHFFVKYFFILSIIYDVTNVKVKSDKPLSLESTISVNQVV